MKLSIFAHYLTPPPACREAEGIPDKKQTAGKFAAQVFVYGSGKDNLDGRYVIRIASGYTFDGASIPRALWTICGHPWQNDRVAAALIHDWLYASKALPRKYADAIYRSALETSGGKPWKAAVEYCALRIFGWAAWKRATAEERETAHKHGRILKGAEDHKCEAESGQ